MKYSTLLENGFTCSIYAVDSTTSTNSLSIVKRLVGCYVAPNSTLMSFAVVLPTGHDPVTLSLGNLRSIQLS